MQRGSSDNVTALVVLLGLWPQGAPDRPLVALISRRNKRLLLNEAELVRAALELGAEVAVFGCLVVVGRSDVRAWATTSPTPSPSNKLATTAKPRATTHNTQHTTQQTTHV